MESVDFRQFSGPNRSALRVHEVSPGPYRNNPLVRATTHRARDRAETERELLETAAPRRQSVPDKATTSVLPRSWSFVLHRWRPRFVKQLKQLNLGPRDSRLHGSQRNRQGCGNLIVRKIFEIIEYQRRAISFVELFKKI